MERKTQTEGPMTKKKMEEYFQAFSKEGFKKAVTDYFAEDAVLENSLAMEACGKKNIIEMMVSTHRRGTVKETLTPTRILIDGDDVAAELVMELEASEDLPDHHLKLKKGEKKRARLAAFYKIRDGKIARVKVYQGEGWGTNLPRFLQQWEPPGQQRC